MAKFKLYEAEQLRDVRALIRRTDTLYGWRTAFRQMGKAHALEDYTYNDLSNWMNGFGTAMIDLGYQGKHIAILGENCFQWVVSYVTILGGLGVAVPLDKELPPEDLSNLINKSDVECIILSRKYAKYVEQLRASCPALSACIVMNPYEEADVPAGCYSMPELIRIGQTRMVQGDRRFLDAPIAADKLTEILFTSGTTGANKGVMLSQKNIMAVVYSSRSHITPGQVLMSVLPINHSYECSTTILTGMYCGATICFNDSLKHVLRNLQLFKPDLMVVVPMFLESMIRNIWNESRKNGLENHLKYGIWFSNLIRKIGIDRRQHFFQPVLDGLGGHLVQIVSGGAPLRAELVKQFDDLGINVINGYGITECAPLVAAGCTAWKRAGSVGKVVPSCKVRIAHKDSSGVGEIEVFGDNVMMGYYKDPESTKKSFTEDGWFRTGDLGSLDKDNFLYLSGRQKNLIILPNGKNVSPEELEEIIAHKLGYAEEVFVYASRDTKGQQEQIRCAVYPNSDWFAEHTREEADKILQDDIHRLNRSLAGYKQIAQACFTETEFEKTTTKKIKRHIVERRFNNA